MGWRGVCRSAAHVEAHDELFGIFGNRGWSETYRAPLMVASEFANDGSVIWATLTNPEAGFAKAVFRRRALTAVLVATLLSLVATALIMPALDSEAVAGDQLRPDMTPHERGEAIERAGKLFQVTTWATATTRPVGSAFLLALVLWLAFKVAGAKTGFKATFTVAAHALLPSALKLLLAAPAALLRRPISPDQVPKLLPSSLAELLPSSLPPMALAVAHAIDLFTVWSIYLTIAGMVKASGASWRRASLVVLVLFAASIALFTVAPS